MCSKICQNATILLEIGFFLWKLKPDNLKLEPEKWYYQKLKVINNLRNVINNVLVCYIRTLLTAFKNCFKISSHFNIFSNIEINSNTKNYSMTMFCNFRVLGNRFETANLICTKLQVDLQKSHFLFFRNSPPPPCTMWELYSEMLWKPKQ